MDLIGNIFTNIELEKRFEWTFGRAQLMRVVTRTNQCTCRHCSSIIMLPLSVKIIE